MEITDKTRQRFAKYVSRNPENGCLEWVGCMSKRGYGKFGVQGQVHGAHRVAWIMKHGEIPPDLQVCHKCDNKKCCDTDHMYIGTHADNMHDAAMRSMFGKRKRTKSEELSKRIATELYDHGKLACSEEEAAGHIDAIFKAVLGLDFMIKMAPAGSPAFECAYRHKEYKTGPIRRLIPFHPLKRGMSAKIPRRSSLS